MKQSLTMQRCWPAGVKGRSRLKTKLIPSLAILTALAVAGPGLVRPCAAEEDGVALAIVYDTSGSMKESVRDSNGQPAPKYVIANRALMAIAKQIQTFATNNSAGTPRKIHAGLFVFSEGGAREAIPF